MKFRLKENEFEAIRFTYASASEVSKFCTYRDNDITYASFNYGYDGDELWGQLYSEEEEDFIEVEPGNWIIREDKYYNIVDNDIFHALFELIPDEEANELGLYTGQDLIK